MDSNFGPLKLPFDLGPGAQRSIGSHLGVCTSMPISYLVIGEETPKAKGMEGMGSIRSITGKTFGLLHAPNLGDP